MDDLEWWTGDRRFGLRLPEGVLKHVLDECERSNDLETGGIVVGYYSPDLHCAVVTDISGAPCDSRRTRSSFFRGLKGLQRWVDRLWKRKHRHYYLGEWHFHPSGSPSPSATDSKQIAEIAASEMYHCPEPLLLIIGGNPATGFRGAAYVYIEEEKSLQEIGKIL